MNLFKEVIPLAEDTNKKPTENSNEKDWEWDAKAPESPLDSIEIDSLSVTPAEQENKAADSPNPQDGCCIICSEKLRKSPSEFYCEVCREKYLKVNFGAKHIILSILVMFIAFIGILSFTTTSAVVSKIADGDENVKNQHYANALDSYNAVDSDVVALNQSLNAFFQGISTNFKTVEFYNSGIAVDKKSVELMVKTITTAYEDREAFMSLVETSFTKKELESDKYAHIKKCYDFCKTMDDTANSIYDGWYTLLNERLSALDENGKLTSNDVPTLDEVIAYLDDYAKKNPKAESSTIEYYKVLTLYYEFSTFGTVEPEKIMAHLETAYEKAGEFAYFYSDYYLNFAWECEEYELLQKAAKEFLDVNPCNQTAYFYLAKLHSLNNEWDKASAVCEELLKYNPDSLDYYLLKAEVLRRSGEFNAAIDICTKGEKIGEDAELIRQKAIAYMLNGEKDKALETADRAYQATYASSYNGGTISLEVINTAALISYLCDSEKLIYNETAELLKSEGIALEASVQSVIDGKTTFKDLFMSEKGDI